MRGSRCGRGAAALLLAGAVAGLAAAPAQAQEYRYWSFWEGKAGSGGSWTYATEGPATLRPADGAVAGFRFTVSSGSAKAGTPRTVPDFTAICRTTPAKPGSKRIGVALDFGTAADAPAGEQPPPARTACAQVPEDASAGDALAAVAKPLRYDANALLCAIAGYPRSGCAEQVSNGSKDGAQQSPGTSAASGTSPAADSGGSGGPSAGLLGGIAAVVVLGAAGVWQARRRRG
ncbi:SCO2322 family protein [Streptomyces sp. CT34]|uniref:SCO2322 family protein n=1 Tax=Streptomyces sp. CT34 TaxID=1553907 RepID=UPI0005BA67F7|nr:SCO2322 family protein [Streptomyces sp. CT34]